MLEIFNTRYFGIFNSLRCMEIASRIIIFCSMFLGFVFTGVHSACSQNVATFEQFLEAETNDSLRIQYMDSLAQGYEGIDYNKSKDYAVQALALAEKKEWGWALISAYRRLNLTYVLEGDFTTALRYGKLFYQKSINMLDSASMSEAINMVGDNYYDLGEYDEAYNYFTEAYRLANKKGNQLRMTIALHNVGRVFKELGQYDRAKQHLLLSMSISESIGDKPGIPYSLHELGDVLLRQGNIDSALIYLKKSLQESRKISDEILEPRTISKIATAYFLNADYSAALIYYDSAYVKNERTKNRLGMAEVELGRGIIYLQQSNYDEAQTTIQRSLTIAQELNARTLELRCYNQLSKFWEEKGDFKKSLSYYKSYKLLEDSLFSQEMNEKLFRDQMRFETESKDSQIAQLSRTEAYQKGEIKKQEFIRNIFVVLMALTGILLITVYRSGQRRRKINGLLLDHQVEMEKRSEELEKLNLVKDKFFSIISHDLRSPINALAGLLDLMDRGAVSADDMSKNIHELKSRFNHTRTLLNNLLDWTLLQMDKLSLQPAKVDMQKLVAENVQMLSSVQEKRIEFNNQVAQGTMVYADSNTINLVIRNLMTNAIKFTNENGHIKISAEEAGNMLKISVTDDGVGMKPEVVKMLFDKTSPYSTRGTANEKGTGLGLILCKEFVEKNGGTISVTSEENKGSIFTFTVPKG
jgi:signal transduction histidine kinase